MFQLLSFIPFLCGSLKSKNTICPRIMNRPGSEVNAVAPLCDSGKKLAFHVCDCTRGLLVRGLMRFPKMLRFTPWILAVAMLAALPACNTMRGLGQDIQAGGRALEGSAERNRTQ